MTIDNLSIKILLRCFENSRLLGYVVRLRDGECVTISKDMMEKLCTDFVIRITNKQEIERVYLVPEGASTYSVNKHNSSRGAVRVFGNLASEPECFGIDSDYITFASEYDDMVYRFADEIYRNNYKYRRMRPDSHYGDVARVEDKGTGY